MYAVITLARLAIGRGVPGPEDPSGGRPATLTAASPCAGQAGTGGDPGSTTWAGSTPLTVRSGVVATAALMTAAAARPMMTARTAAAIRRPLRRLGLGAKCRCWAFRVCPPTTRSRCHTSLPRLVDPERTTLDLTV